MVNDAGQMLRTPFFTGKAIMKNRTLLFVLSFVLLTGTVNGQMYPQKSGNSGRPGNYLLPGQQGNPQANPTNRRPTGAPVPKALPSRQLAAPGLVPKARENRTSCLMESSRKADSVDLVEILLEVNGTVVPQDTKDRQPEKIEVLAGFRYEERTEEYTWGPNIKCSSVRLYDQAGMKQTFRDKTNRPLLDASRRYIVAGFDGKKMLRYSTGGPLQNEQYLLLEELPFDTLLLDQLVPNRQVNLGEEWTVPDETLKAMLGLEAIQRNTVRLVLTAIIDDIAEVDIYLNGGKDASGKQLPGSLEGASMGSTVSLDIQGKYQFDLRNRRMTWFGVRMEEIRGGSLIEPQIESTAILRIKTAPLTGSEKLTREVVESLPKELSPDRLLIAYNGQTGPWRFRHTRKWKMIEDNDRSAALCLIDKGETIAQCNIMLGSKVDSSTMPSLEAYKKELRKGLGEQFGKIVHESEVVDQNKYLIYSVMIDGTAEELPFRWLYYLLTDPEGNQVTVMFEIRAEMLDRFEGQSEEIIQSFRIIPPAPEEKNTGISATVEEKQ